MSKNKDVIGQEFVVIMSLIRIKFKLSRLTVRTLHLINTSRAGRL